MSKKLSWILWGLGLSCVTAPALAFIYRTSLDATGIDALRLHKPPYNLTGRKIAIGQVEIGRPGKFGVDKSVSKKPNLSVEGVFSRNEPAKSNSGVDTHAHNVAGIMVSNDKAFPGIAPNARLYSSAVGAMKGLGQPQECLSAQHIALQNGGDIRAINFSFGEPLSRDPRANPILDGNALLTMCVDWSSRVHNVLYVVAGNQGKGGIPIPTDNYNAVNVAFSSRREGIFSKVDVSNLAAVGEGATRRLAGKEFNFDNRRSVGIVAPGYSIPTVNPNGSVKNVTGTSFAAPHVTATVALLQEFGDRMLRQKQPRWTTAARRQEVMKVVLLNSAEKLRDEGNGLRLGMTRTLIDKQNKNWLESDAYQDAKIPLDAQMGTGHLHAFRAYQQFSAGQFNSSQPVPPLGWDYGEINLGTPVEYTLAKPLKAGSFVSVTLTWNRLVELSDRNQNQMFDEGENFRDRGLNNLNLYLVPVNASPTDKGSICASTSEVDNVEHIFCPVSKAGNYKIRVEYAKQVHEPTQAYAIAWWTVSEN
ncbi:S8 family serine peptidase [Calothrix sp. NIES-3974]|uniref:S8 family serine peptidase n=1 Tax=Calothrix sp. NIES-3974 TaxID=2005462 RepID=UPI000B5EDA07|nr:S8 family serine peptidase [Calothrix sp. NIES-3974]BAZ06053.1 hypothetical protein NIES3974_27100 [Calothrix sp. NIES-3974]